MSKVKRAGENCITGLKRVSKSLCVRVSVWCKCVREIVSVNVCCECVNACLQWLFVGESERERGDAASEVRIPLMEKMAFY